MRGLQVRVGHYTRRREGLYRTWPQQFCANYMKARREQGTRVPQRGLSDYIGDARRVRARPSTTTIVLSSLSWMNPARIYLAYLLTLFEIGTGSRPTSPKPFLTSSINVSVGTGSNLKGHHSCHTFNRCGDCHFRPASPDRPFISVHRHNLRKGET
jgi:hypothetical protein